jgi:hypothetical protein
MRSWRRRQSKSLARTLLRGGWRDESRDALISHAVASVKGECTLR